jgi:hypothetical protein
LLLDLEPCIDHILLTLAIAAARAVPRGSGGGRLLALEVLRHRLRGRLQIPDWISITLAEIQEGGLA